MGVTLPYLDQIGGRNPGKCLVSARGHGIEATESTSTIATGHTITGLMNAIVVMMTIPTGTTTITTINGVTFPFLCLSILIY